MRSATVRLAGGRRSRRTAGAGALAAVFVLLAGSSARAEVGITGDHRLLQRFVEDGALVRKGWLGVSGSISEFDGGRDLEAAIAAAFRFGRDVEAGVIVGGLDRIREVGEPLFGSTLSQDIDASGFTKVSIYGKYRILRSPFEMSAGALVAAPLSAEKRGVGTGTYETRAFLGLRRAFPRATMVWSLGVADRGDPDGAGRAPATPSALLGSGLLVPLSYEWTFLAELNYEGRQYVGAHQDVEVLAGLDWRPAENMVFRGGLAAGLSDAAPDLSAVLSAAFHF